MSETINLDASPIVQTNVDRIEENLRADELAPTKDLSTVQAQERIERLSQEIRFLVDENKKLTASNRHLARDRGDMAGALLSLEREIIELRKGDEQLFEDKPAPVPEPMKSPEESPAAFVARYFTESQMFSNFFNSTREDRKHGSANHFMNAAVGLMEESGEALSVLENGGSVLEDFSQLKSEIGDLEWYVAMTCSALGYSMEKLVEEAFEHEITPSNVNKCIDAINRSAVVILGHAKKSYFHGHNLDKSAVWAYLKDIQSLILDVCGFVGWELRDVMGSNLAKLRKRYPEGRFTEKHSIERIEYEGKSESVGAPYSGYEDLERSRFVTAATVPPPGTPA